MRRKSSVKSLTTYDTGQSEIVGIIGCTRFPRPVCLCDWHYDCAAERDDRTLENKPCRENGLNYGFTRIVFFRSTNPVSFF